MNAMQQMGTLAVLVLMAAGSSAEVMRVERPDVSRANPSYIGSRAPLQATPLIKLPIRSIESQGWLRKQLELEAEGFTGHLGSISRFLQKPGNAWLASEGQHGWEEVPYWLKGYINVAYLLRDESMIQEAHTWIEAALRSQKPDGWFGPESNRTRLNGNPDLWPNMIMQFCLQDYYDVTEDERVTKLLTNYCEYLSTIPDEKFLPGYWDTMRGGDLLFTVYWLYNRTGDASLLELARKVHANTASWETWSEDPFNWHNVNLAQAFGEPTTFWLQSAAPVHLHASYRNYDKIMSMHGQVPGGMFGADENARPGCDDPRQAVETCGMVEMMLSAETLTWITGDLLWADRCEDVAFNSLPAALTADMKSLRYLTAPNLAVSDQHSHSPGFQNSGPMLHFNPHLHRCCQHNWGHGWPYYAQHLYFATPDQGLAAVFYGESRVKIRVADDMEIEVHQETHYPFDDHVFFVVATPKPVTFPLYLRVPGWCQIPRVAVNGDPQPIQGQSGRFLRISREWRDGDRVTLMLPMEIKLRRWHDNHQSVSVDRGPLTYSLKIGENRLSVGGTEDWPAWELHPTTPWNYGLVIDAEEPTRAMHVVEKEWPANDMPFTPEGTPLEITAKGKRIPEWKLDRFGLVAELQDSPVKSAEPAETIQLIPMGAARLRICSFPVIGDGPDAHGWEPPPEPLPYSPQASHCFHGDTVDALCDKIEPTHSNDHGLPRFTFWDHRGTQEWVQYTFEQPKKISRVGVYWFDDTGRGQCRVPASWRLLYRVGDQWQPVETDATFGAERDRYNSVRFTPLTTTGLRLEIELQPEFSAGILEWQVE
jgi:hypothetical protein